MGTFFGLEGKFKEFGLSNYPAWQVVRSFLRVRIIISFTGEKKD